MTKQTAQPIFLTGGTGFLGSHIGAELLRRGYEVFFLVRNNHQFSATERLANILDWHEVRSSLRNRSHVVEGDTTQPDLGIRADQLDHLNNAFAHIIHCASHTSFVERNREAVTAVNVAGLNHLLDFAEKSGCPEFHHISTAYVAGRQQGECPEYLVNGNRKFFNVYEETKCQAEWLAWKRCQAANIQLKIYRPSIVYGHSQTGRTFRFNALYYPVRTILFFKKLYEEDIHECSGAKAEELGVSIDQNGVMHLPLRIERSEDVGVNLIPVDYFVAAFFAILENADAEGIFHIVNDKMKRIDHIIAYLNERFRLKGIRGCSSADYGRTSKNALEKMFEYYLDAYGPYIRDVRTFSRENAWKILKEQEITCPDFDFEIFSRCMDYALKMGWRMNNNSKPARESHT